VPIGVPLDMLYLPRGTLSLPCGVLSCLLACSICFLACSVCCSACLVCLSACSVCLLTRSICLSACSICLAACSVCSLILSMSCSLCPSLTSSICLWMVVMFECLSTCLVGNWMFAGSLSGSCEGEEGKMKNSPIKLFTCFVVSANVALRRAFCFAVSLVADDDGCNQGEGPAGSFMTLIEVCGGRLRLLEETGGNNSVVQAHKGLYSNLKGRGVDESGGFPGGRTLLGSNPTSQSFFPPKSSLLLVATTGGLSQHFFMKPRKTSFCFGMILLPGMWLRARGFSTCHLEFLELFCILHNVAGFLIFLSAFVPPDLAVIVFGSDNDVWIAVYFLESCR
jgi:hypothetical protein